MKALLLTLLIVPSIAVGQYKGFSAFAAQHPKFPCGRFLQISRHADKPIMAVLFSTFGSKTACIKKFAHKFKDRPHAIEIHFNNETCRRGGRTCYEQELFKRLSPSQYSNALQRMSDDVRNRIQKRLSRIIALTESGNSNTRFLLSLGLEDEYHPEAAVALFNVVKKSWPYEIVRNPAGEKSDDRNADIIELHSANSIFGKNQVCLFNQDGLEGGVEQAEFLFAKYRRCVATIAWTKEAQGIGEKFTPPLERTFKISRKDVKDYGRLLRRSNTTH
jgi:hypothetical protein